MPQTMIDAFTWQDFQMLPQDNLRYEILDGELVVSPAPNSRHQDLVLRLTDQFLAAVHKPGLGRLMLSPFDVKLSNTDVFEPDLMVILPQHAHRVTVTHLEGPPDLAIEIVSRGSARRDRRGKLRRCELHGIPEYWIVDPQANVADQHVLEGGAYRHQGRFADLIEPHILPGVQIDMTKVW